MKEGRKNSGRICTWLLAAAIFAVIGAGMSFWYTGAHAEVTPNSVIYVTESGSGAKDGTSWENAMAGASLDAAAAQAKESFVADSATAPVVWVANGTYTRTKTIALDKGVRMYGGFNGTEKTLEERPAITPDAEFTGADTIISRDASLVSTDKFPLITGGSTAVSTDTILDGFTVTGGIAQFGGGMYNEGSSPSVVSCTFAGNTASSRGGGGGGGMYNKDSSPSVVNCAFAGNTASGNGGGGMYNEGSSSSIINCTFTGNIVAGYSYGGGMCNLGASPTITGCIFSANHADAAGGGMSNYNSSAKVSNCSFAENIVNGNTVVGGGVYNQIQSGESANPIFTNCTFAANTAANGGGMFNDGRGRVGAVLSVDVVNCTFAENNADNGGGMYNQSPGAIASVHTNICNSVFYGNSASNNAEIGSDKGDNTHVTVTNCVVSGGYAGGINTEEPKLISLDKNLRPAANAADVYVYAISGDSSALQLGKSVGTKVSEGVLVPSDDQTGIARKLGVNADVGSYSYNIVKPDISSVSMNPTSASITVGTSKTISLKSENAIPDAVFNGTLWTSSNEDIASVKESGKGVLVKALKEGKAIITATIGKIGPRSETLEEVSLSADITVKPVPTPTGGSGCSAGFAALALLAVIPVVLKKKK